MKTKVYLAKSNRSNPTHVSRVRAELEKYNLEIVEYSGGSYSNKPLLNSDYLVVIPDLSNYDFDYHINNEYKNDYDESENFIILGKGLYNQISEFRAKNKVKKILVLKYIDENDMFFSHPCDMDIEDSNDYITYGYTYFKPKTSDLTYEFLEKQFNRKDMETKESKESKWSWEHDIDIDVATNAIVEGLKKLQKKGIGDEVNARGFNKRRLLLAV